MLPQLSLMNVLNVLNVLNVSNALNVLQGMLLVISSDVLRTEPFFGELFEAADFEHFCQLHLVD